MRCIMKTDKDAIIHMDQVSWDIEAWYRIAEFRQDLPVNLTDAIMGFGYWPNSVFANGDADE